MVSNVTGWGSTLPVTECTSQEVSASQSASASTHVATGIMRRQNRTSREIWGANELTAELLGRDLDDIEGTPAADPGRQPIPSQTRMLHKRQAEQPPDETRPKSRPKEGNTQAPGRATMLDKWLQKMPLPLKASKSDRAASSTATAVAKQQAAQPQPPPPTKPAFGIIEESFSVLTWNVMGLTTILEELQELINEHEPTVVILTETKLAGKHEHMRWVRQAFQGKYCLHFSSQSHTKQKDDNVPLANRRQNHMQYGSGGVILAIQKRWTDACELTRHSYHNMPYMKGHAVGASLRLPDGPKLELIGAYLPSSGGIDIGEEDKAIHKRERIYSAVRQQVADKQYVLAAGDWNAAFLPADRSQHGLHT